MIKEVIKDAVADFWSERRDYFISFVKGVVKDAIMECKVDFDAEADAVAVSNTSIYVDKCEEPVVSEEGTLYAYPKCELCDECGSKTIYASEKTCATCGTKTKMGKPKYILRNYRSDVNGR